MSKLADTRTICQRVPTVIFHDRTSGRQSLQLGVSGHSMRPALERPEWWLAVVPDLSVDDRHV
ncbi:hypothetical protein, partial [Sphingomonas sp. Leaf20]|uniref:hypothetical protein n=1 Tax=Sphingomonas sp. Leaf20 TaxID=1735685 RepID=UPI001F3D350E